MPEVFISKYVVETRFVCRHSRDSLLIILLLKDNVKYFFKSFLKNFKLFSRPSPALPESTTYSAYYATPPQRVPNCSENIFQIYLLNILISNTKAPL